MNRTLTTSERHGIAPQEVLEVFLNEAVDLDYETVNGEERWTSVGHSNQLRVLVVIWTMRGEVIRPVTAFEAGKRLAEDYFKGDRTVSIWRSIVAE